MLRPRKEHCFNYKEKTLNQQGLVTKRWDGFHLSILYPSKNRVRLSPIYQVKSFWKIWRPEKNTSSTAFKRDLVVGVSQPHDDSVISPLGSISAILLPCSLTLVKPSESTSTEVLDLCQSVRVAIAACICRSILRIGELVDYPSIVQGETPNKGVL
mgnify:CR=1 FL=1